MDWSLIISYINGGTYFLVFFGIFFLLSILKGRQAVINITIGIYLALLLSLKFPNKDVLFADFNSDLTLFVAKITSFAFVCLFTIFLCHRIMPDEFKEEKFESIFKKMFLSFGATILVVSTSFQLLPTSEIFNLGASLTPLFSPENFYFWWLLLPLVILYVM